MNPVRIARYCAGILVVLQFLSACTTPAQTLRLQQQQLEIPRLSELTDTPFFPQLDYYCGPATLAAMANYREIATSPDELSPLIYVPGLQGSLQEEVIAASRQLGLLPVELDGKIESMFREIAAGNPVLVLQNLGFDIIPKWHYAIVVGYDLDQQTIIMRSGTYERLVRPFSVFERTWQRAGLWSLVIVQPGQLPVSVDSNRYTNALLEFEQNAKVELSYQAYKAALNKWPTNLVAQLGLANSAYALESYYESEQGFKAALELAPDNADIWNNLAYALAKQGKSRLSIESIRKAIKLAPDETNYQSSLSELQQWFGLD